MLRSLVVYKQKTAYEMLRSLVGSKQKTAYEMLRSLVGSEMCIRDSSNTDRLFAMWQTAAGKAWRLDSDRVYGSVGNALAIVSNLEPWAGGEGLRPWAPPDDQQVAKNCKHPSVVIPPRYDTTPSSPGHEVSPWPLVRRGDQHHPVRTLQYLLRARGQLVTVDGIFGAHTEAAVRAFQQRNHLSLIHI